MLKVFILFIHVFAISYTVNSHPSLPPEPSLPKFVCRTLRAELTHSSNLLHDDDESKPDSKRIQGALNECTSGHAVKLIVNGGKNSFLTGPLVLPNEVTLWIDKGVTLFASRNPRDYDIRKNSCAIVASDDGGCHSLITATNTRNSGVVGDGVIDGRGGSTLIGLNESWWDIGHRAKGAEQNNPRLIQVNGGNNFLLYKITIHNGPKFHVVPNNMSGFIAWGVKIKSPTLSYPKYTFKTAHNTDGIDPIGSSNVVIAYSYIDTGDDHIAIKTDSGPSRNITVMHNHFYHGHGMSIGSHTTYGVSDVFVSDLTIDGADNGLRIKSDVSRGGIVHGIRYENICIRNVDNSLLFDPFYSNRTGTLYPQFYDISLSGVHIISSNRKHAVFRGYDDKHILKITLDNVISDVPLTKLNSSNAEITLGPGEVKNIPIVESETNNVKIKRGSSHVSTPVDCDKMFVSFPSLD